MNRQRWVRFIAFYLVCALFVALGYFAGQADAQTDPFAIGHEVGTAPALYESYDEAAAYWAQVPGVPNIQDACGPPPIIYSVDTGRANAWGKAKTGDDPCKIWFEDRYMTFTAALSRYRRDLDRCIAVVHEYGHVLGLLHQDYGDPNKVMLHGSTPDVCIRAYLPAHMTPSEAFAAPLTASVEETEGRTLCMPAWTFYGPQKVFKLYKAGRAREARRAFKRWAKRHRREARKASGEAATCIDPLTE